MATAVQIELMVDEKGAVSGVRAFDTAVKGATGSVGRLNTELRLVGPSTAAGAAQAKTALEGVGRSAMSAREEARLMNEELHLGMSRAMLGVVADTDILRGAISAIGPALIGIGAAGILIGIGKEMYDLYEKYIDINAAANEYQKTLEKTRETDFGNSHDIETTTMRIREATQAAKDFRAEAESAHRSSEHALGLGAIAGLAMGPFSSLSMDHGAARLLHAKELADKSVAKQEQVDTLRAAQAQQKHELTLLAIQATHAKDDLGRKLAENQENYSYSSAQNTRLGNPGANDAGALKKKYEDQIALNESKKDQKSHAEELARIHEQAVESSLRGSELYHAKEAAAIDDLKRRGIASPTAVNDVQLKFHNEEMRRLEDEQRITAGIVEQTKLASLTGIARVQAEGQGRVDRTKSDPNLDPTERDKRVAAIQEATAAEVAEKQMDWAHKVDEVIAQSQQRQVSGFARIRDEADKASAALQRQFEEAHNQMDLTAPGAQAALNSDSTKLGAGLDAIRAGADRQQADLALRNSQETEQIEAKARSRFMNAEKQKTDAIAVEYNQRLQKYQAELKAQEISEDDYNRRVAAAAMERDAEMVQAATEAREKMAGQFESLFRGMDHPLRMLEQMGEKGAAQAAAAMVQRMQQHAHGGGASPSSGGSGISLLDSVMGGFGLGRKGAGLGADHAAEMAGTHTRASGDRVFSIQMATIHVGAASFGGGGMMSAGGFGVPGAAGGSTGMLRRASWSPGASAGGGGASWGSGTYGSGDFAGGYSSGGFSGGGYSGSGGGYSGGAPPIGPSGGVVSNLGQGVDIFKQAKGLFGSKGPGVGVAPGAGGAETSSYDLGGTFGADGSFTSAPTGAAAANPGMLAGGGLMANAGGAAGGAMGLYAAARGGGGAGGALGGAMSGMQLGMAVGGPMGAAIGAAAGAIIGGIGSSEQARVYDLKTIRPKLEADQASYAQGGMDYMTAYSDVQQMIGTSWAATKKMGAAGEHYWSSTIKPELLQAMGKFTAQQRAGRSMYTAQTASFDVGTDSVPRDGMALIHRNERIIPSDQNEQITRALNVHAKYRTAMGASGRGASPGGDRTMNMHVHAIDSKGVAQFFDQYKHVMRGAMNDSFAENSGGGL